MPARRTKTPPAPAEGARFEIRPLNAAIVPVISIQHAIDIVPRRCLGARPRPARWRRTLRVRRHSAGVAFGADDARRAAAEGGGVMAGKPRPARDLRELLGLPDAALITETEAGNILDLSPATLRNRRVDLPDRPAKPSRLRSRSGGRSDTASAPYAGSRPKERRHEAPTSIRPRLPREKQPSTNLPGMPRLRRGLSDNAFSEKRHYFDSVELQAPPPSRGRKTPLTATAISPALI